MKPIPLISADKVEGTDIYNLEGKHLGEIESLMIDKLSGKVAYAVVVFGGFRWESSAVPCLGAF